MRRVLRASMIVALWLLPGLSFAQGQGATITSREVGERLTRLEEGQKALAQRLEDVNTTLGQRIDDTNKRIEDLRTDMNNRFADLRAEMNGRFADLRTDMNRRFDDVNSRFDDVNSRFNDVMTLLQIIISTLVALVLAIAGAGFVMWRKILAVDTAVQTKVGLDQAVREQVLHLEQEMGFVKGKLKELSEALGQR